MNASENPKEASSPEVVVSENDAKEHDEQSATQAPIASDEVSQKEADDTKGATDGETLEQVKVEEKKPAKKTAKKATSTAKKTTPKKKTVKDKEK